jgi:HEAT repeat protein
MDIPEIEVALNNPDFQYRVQAVKALKDYDSEVSVPLLTSRLHDSEFLVRSLVAMGLGHQRTAESFAALLEMLTFDRDTNVKAEVANSLSLFGQIAIPHLVKAFYQNENWLIRRSILACLVEMDCPKELFEVCLTALDDEDQTVQESAVGALGLLANSDQQGQALVKLLDVAKSNSWRIRIRAAHALKQFNDPQAQEVLAQLRQDEDHRVVAAALEGSV